MSSQSLPAASHPGWYEDPEAADLLRWWDGAQWSDTDFRAKPEDSAIAKYAKSHRDLAPTSPTNYLAKSALVCATIVAGLACALVLSVFLLPPANATFQVYVLLLLGSATVLGLGVWSAGMSVIGIINGRRHAGTRVNPAILALIISVIGSVAVVPAVLLVLAELTAHRSA